MAEIKSNNIFEDINLSVINALHLDAIRGQKANILFDSISAIFSFT